MKILVNTPSLKSMGGVANHYKGLRAFWTENVMYNTVGKRNATKCGSGKYWLLWDCLKFIFRLLTFCPDVVLVNPSLGTSALKRDFFFLNVAHALGFKVVVFIHGFNWDYAKTINKKWVVRHFNKASLIFVLANAFKEEMKSWGVTSPISLTTTKVDDALLENFNPMKDKTFSSKNILFLSRIEKAKGVYEAVDAFAILKQKYSDLTLTFVGDGSELKPLKKYVADKDLSDVIFTGRLDGEALKNEYKNALLLLLTTHGEGMPTVVLEAMAFGLPILTRNVGGLVDFFKNDKMGFITDSLEPKDFADAMVPYIKDKELARKVGAYNAQYAKEHFMASSVARQIENTIKETIRL